MYRFLMPLLAGFALAGASAFTAAFSRRWGVRGGQIATSVLRNLLGIPLYFLGLVLAWQAPAPLLFDSGNATQVAAWLLIAAGSIPVVAGHLQLGWSTHMPSMRDSLVTTGLYAHVRHPIYAGGLVVFVGLALLHPTVAFALACALSCAFFVVQARLEEIDLIERLPEYREYLREVPALLPRFGIKPPTGASPVSPFARWWWLCPWLAIALAAALFALWGLTWWTALLAALLVVCPVLIIWGMVNLSRKA